MRACSERGPTQLNIPRDYFYGEVDCEIPQPQRVERGPGGRESLDEAAELLAKAQVPGDRRRRRRHHVGRRRGGVALAEYLRRPVVNSYLHNDASPPSHPLWCGPLGYQGSKAAMKLIAKADVVLALGTRLGPFGTLPQHGLDYWPKNAKIIQVDSRPPHARASSSRSRSASAATPRRRQGAAPAARQPRSRGARRTPPSA